MLRYCIYIILAYFVQMIVFVQFMTLVGEITNGAFPKDDQWLTLWFADLIAYAALVFVGAMVAHGKNCPNPGAD